MPSVLTDNKADTFLMGVVIRINDLIVTECSDILRWKVTYNFEWGILSNCFCFGSWKSNEIKAMLIYKYALAQIFHLLLEDQEFTNGVQKKVCNTIIRNFDILFFRRLIESLQDDFTKLSTNIITEFISANIFHWWKQKSLIIL